MTTTSMSGSPPLLQASPGFQAPAAMEVDQATVLGNTKAGTRQRTRRIACIGYRQSKHKCEGFAKNSACSRCRRLATPCVVDSDFKRENRRRKLEDLTEELVQLRSLVDPSQKPGLHNVDLNSLHTDTFDPSLREVHRRQNATASPSRSILSSQHHSQLPVEHSDTRSLPPHNVPSIQSVERHSQTRHRQLRIPLYNLKASRSWVLDNITLHPDQSSRLFKFFFEYHHPFFPILDTRMSPDDYFAKSQLLAWSILTIGARRLGTDFSIYPRLTAGVQKLVWSKMSTSPHAHYTIQAILLLCNWPFNTTSMTTDPSYMLISMAKTAAMRLGLHRPEILQDYLRVRYQLNHEELLEAVKLWAGCFITSEAVTMTEGQCSLFPVPDTTIELICAAKNHYGLPQDLRHNLLIHRFLNRIDNFVGRFGDHSIGMNPRDGMYDMMASLEVDFRSLELDLEEDISAHNWLFLRCTEFQLAVFHLLQPLSEQRRTIGMLKAFKAAKDLIEALGEAESDWEGVKCAPRLFATLITSSAALASRFVHSDKSDLIDVAAGEKVFRIAITLHDSMSVESTDYSTRAPRMLKALWDVYEASPFKPQRLELKLQTRRGASLVYDVVQEWRDHFGHNSLEDLFRRPPRIPPSLVLQKSSRLLQTPEKDWTELQDHHDLADSSEVNCRTNTHLPNACSTLPPEGYSEPQNGLRILPSQDVGTSSVNGMSPPWDDLAPDTSFLSYPDWTWDSRIFADGQL